MIAGSIPGFLLSGARSSRSFFLGQVAVFFQPSFCIISFGLQNGDPIPSLGNVAPFLE
jgi:hypothetical protein